MAKRSVRGRVIVGIVVGAMWLGLAAPSAFAYNVRKCDPIAEGDVSLAADYITRRVQQLADQFTHLSVANREEFVRKWPRVDIVCQDEGQRGKSRDCLASTQLGGFSHGGVGNNVNVCYYNLVEGGYQIRHAGVISRNLCGLVAVIVHESGHAHGFPAFENHNNWDNYTRQNDPVYVMGDRAYAFCTADAAIFTDAPLIGRTDLALNDVCRADEQCQSGRCLGGVCQCDQDADCPSAQRCFKPAVGRNVCRSEALALNAVCSRDAECRSDHCENGRCVCRRDGDCPTGQVCRTPITGANTCVAGTDGNLAVNAACQRDNQCKSGSCEGGRCVCRSDGDCPTGQSCYTPIGQANFCASTTVALNGSCNRDSQCRSDKCQGGQCRCNKDSDCGDGRQCKKPLIGNNHCE